MKVLILANHYNTLRIFRRELIKAIANKGCEVVISIPECDDKNKQLLESYGSRVVFTEVDRRGTNPLSELVLLNNYRKLIRDEKPDKVITYTVKCNIYGALACKKGNIPHYANITGLGSSFQGENAVRKIVSFLYKFALKKTKRVFLENHGNRDTLVNDGIIRAEQAVVLPGAGVNLDDFAPVDFPAEGKPIRFLFAARIMQEKGVDEYFDAITRIKKVRPDVQFDFIGWYEDNYEKRVKSLTEKGYLNYYGFQHDVKPFIEQSHCIVLPSWHEGMSNTLLESAAMCRPLIASNINGCRETIDEGISGLLADAHSADSLYEVLMKFIELSHEDKVSMGLAGRKRMEKIFNKEIVVGMTMKEIFD